MYLKKFPPSDQQPLSTGERLCDFPFLDPSGRPLSLYGPRIFGWPKAIFAGSDPAALRRELPGFAARAPAFRELEVMTTAVTPFAPAENAALCRELGLPFPLLCDPEGAFFTLLRDSAIAPDRTLLFDSILRFEEVLGSGCEGRQAEAALAWARGRARPADIVTAQAPVLVLPNVLDADFCRRLIAFWENNDQFDGGISSDRGAAGTQVKSKTKVRRDVILPDDTPEGRDLIAVLGRRLLPEILKAFSFRTTGFEAFRIGCYDAADGGHFAAHRDNVVPQSAHRRFAVSFNLNDGFEGGSLRLPEFGPQLYAPPPGGAVVFSCSLLHLVTPMTRGRRFGLFLFLAGPEQTAGMEGAAQQG